MNRAHQPPTADHESLREGKLTWYPDSLLPYSSLWHTCRRAIHLNALQTSELQAVLPRRRASRSEAGGRTMNLAPWIARNTTRLAEFLGVPEYQTLWMGLSFLPAWVVHTISTRPRVCLSCLLQGYHSSLYSFSWLHTCPLHAQDLVDHCPCGQALSYRLAVQDLVCPSSCSCGRMTYFDADTCRQPALTLKDIHALDELAHWLQILMMTVRMEHWGPLPLNLASSSSLQSQLRAWSQRVGIRYPGCLQRFGESSHAPQLKAWGDVVTYRANSALSRSQLSYHLLARWRYAGWTPLGSDLTRQDPILVKAMARHLRRHLMPSSRRWIHRLQASAYGPQMLTWIQHSKSAFGSYAYMLWCRILGLDEATAWSGRGKHDESGSTAGRGHPESVIPEPPYRSKADKWAGRHLVAQALLDLWWAVLEQVRACVQAGHLKWHLTFDWIEQMQRTQAMADVLDGHQLRLVVQTQRPAGLLRAGEEGPFHGIGTGMAVWSPDEVPIDGRAQLQAQVLVGIVGFWGMRG